MASFRSLPSPLVHRSADRRNGKSSHKAFVPCTLSADITALRNRIIPSDCPLYRPARPSVAADGRFGPSRAMDRPGPKNPRRPGPRPPAAGPARRRDRTCQCPPHRTDPYDPPCRTRDHGRNLPARDGRIRHTDGDGLTLVDPGSPTPRRVDAPRRDRPDRSGQPQRAGPPRGLPLRRRPALTVRADPYRIRARRGESERSLSAGAHGAFRGPVPGRPSGR
jgi:hypothetical protein